MPITPLNIFRKQTVLKNQNSNIEKPKDNPDSIKEFSWDCYSRHAFFQFMSAKRTLELLELQEKLGLNFKDINLLNQVFIHGSNKLPNNITHKETYQNLEFYGDTILSACIKRLFFEEMQPKNLKTANSIYDNIASNNNLAKYSYKLGLDKFIITKQESKKQKADVFEALLAAITINYKDEGFDKAYEFFKNTINKETSDKIKNSTNRSQCTELKKPLHSSKTLSKAKIKKLNNFQEKYQLNFKDLNFLNKVFNPPYRNKSEMNDYNFMTYFGRSLFYMSITRLIIENYQNYRESDYDKIREICFKSENLIKKFYKLELDKFCNSNSDEPLEKSSIDKFYNLYCAIYLNNKKDGFNKIYEFTKEIFKGDVKKTVDEYDKYYSSHDLIINYLADKKVDMDKVNFAISNGRKKAFCVFYDNNLLLKVIGSKNDINAAMFKEVSKLFEEGYVKITKYKDKEGNIQSRLVTLKPYHKTISV